MGRDKLPADVIAARGNSHIGQDELSRRRSAEVALPADQIAPPRWLPSKQRKEFERLAELLKPLGLLTNLDCDTLAQYVDAMEEYIQVGKELRALLREIAKAPELVSPMERAEAAKEARKEYGAIQKRYFDQAATCARALGLNVSSRCKIEIPKAPEPKQNKFLQPGRARDA